MIFELSHIPTPGRTD